MESGDGQISNSYRSLLRNLPLALCRVNGDALTPFYAELGICPDTDIAAFFRERPDLRDRAAQLCIIEEVNPLAVQLFGARSADDLLGRSVAFVWRARPDHFVQTLIAGVQGRNYECETRLCTLDGRSVDVILASAMVRENGRRASIIGMIDIGERLAEQAELLRLQSQFAHSYRLSILSELSAWFAHEISQPLVAIAATGSTGRRWLDREAPGIEEARSAFDRVVAYAARASGIIDRVRAMASSYDPILTPAPLGDVVFAALKLVEAQAAAFRVTIDYRRLGSDDLVSVDRTQIGQVVVNLVTNAIEAIERVSPCERRIEVVVQTTGCHAECEVVDSGPGISDREVGHVFDDFAPGSSPEAGFGLAVSRSIIALHHGQMLVERGARLGGARVVFQLPLACAYQG